VHTLAIQVQHLSADIGSTAVLHSIDLDIRQGQWCAIVGPNGAGKSTLLKALAGLHAYQGQVQVLGQNLRQLPARQRAQQLAWMGQNQSGADDLTVYDVTMLGRLPYQGWLAAPSQADHAAVRKALHTTHAWDWRERALGTLSGGERQRVLLARLLAVQAQVLLMDEPLANLDPPHQTDWLHTVRGLVAQGKTVVSVLHEISFALQADTLLILAQGKIQHHGACAHPATHRALEAVFDHRIAVHTVDGMHVALPHHSLPLIAATDHSAQ
jgi:iron complex transport system ATP-binding protein